MSTIGLLSVNVSTHSEAAGIKAAAFEKHSIVSASHYIMHAMHLYHIHS